LEKTFWSIERRKLNKMKDFDRLKNLSVPSGKIDVVLDTDAFNEVDDQFAIAYLLRSKDKLNVKALYAAPFFNSRSTGPDDGMEKSYNEIIKLLDLMGESVDVFKGSKSFLKDEVTPVISPAAQDLARRANDYSPENPLYVVAIGAITDVASAILINPKMVENVVVVWLGGHSHEYHDTYEFNMEQDIASARVVTKSGVPFVQLPCQGVVHNFTFSEADLVKWFSGKNPLSSYLAENTLQYMSKKDGYWAKTIWDVTAVAWLLNDDDEFMLSRVVPTKLPSYDYKYEDDPIDQVMRYVYYIKKVPLVNDLIKKITM